MGVGVVQNEGRWDLAEVLHDLVEGVGELVRRRQGPLVEVEVEVQVDGGIVGDERKDPTRETAVLRRSLHHLFVCRQSRGGWSLGLLDLR